MNDRWPLYDGPPDQGRGHLKVLPQDLTPGRRIDTEAETGCEVIGPVDENGSFAGRDSAGVECQFDVRMVVRVHP